MSARTSHTPLALPTRESTQAKLDLRSQVAMRHRLSQTYCMAERLEEVVERHGQRACLRHGTQVISYAELNRQVNRTAHALREQGVRRGDVLALAMESRPAFLVAWLALAKLGVVVAFLNTHVRGQPLTHALQATGATRVIVGEECLALFDGQAAPPPLWLWPDDENPDASGSRARCVLNLEAASLGQPITNPPAAWREGLVAGHPAIYIFTSGTTGLPKAAVISHARWLITGDVMQLTMGITEHDCFYTFLPLYHGAAALSAGATALAAGASLLLRRKFSRSAFWSDVREHGATACQYVGEICRFVLSAPPREDDALHPLRKMVGAGLAPEVWEQWVARFGAMDIYEGWGATEANANTLNVDNRVGSCGRVPFWEKTNLRLVRFDADSGTHPRGSDGYMQLCASGEVGEAIGMILEYPDIAAGRFEGYTSAEATEKKVLRNVFREGDAWWSSGDLLRCDADGYCWFVDRIGDTFRWKSENVSTTEVADVLGEHAGLDAITVYGVQVPEHEGRAGMAALVLAPGAHFDSRAFFEHTAARLPRYAAPLFVRLSAAADMTGNYKLRKVDLQRQGFDAALVAEPLLVRDEAARDYVPLSAEALARALGAP